MGGEAAIYILGDCFGIGVGGTGLMFEHGQPSGFVLDPDVLMREFEAAFG